MPKRAKRLEWQRWVARGFVHAAVVVIGATALGAAVLWPRWARWQTAQSELRLQEEAGAQLRERHEFLLTTQRAHEAWSAQRRRALLPGEIPGFLLELRRLLQPTGVRVARLERETPVASVVNTTAVPVALLDATAPPEAAGSVRPVAVIAELQGDFAAIYRSIARLEAQRFLALVRSAELARIAPGDARLRAVLRIHLYVLETEGTHPLTATLPDAPPPVPVSKVARG